MHLLSKLCVLLISVKILEYTIFWNRWNIIYSGVRKWNETYTCILANESKCENR